MIERNLLTTREVCQYVGFSKRTLERLIEDGRGPRRVRISTRRLGYPKTDLDQWLAAREERH
ncbi:helix-turn-helix domain-containing protein [Acidiphilium sp. PM]|uniref:helix-turn-helix transcriptional regulator n=1 Tax=Acidiphilium TaxID=522 RepID=UPI0009D6A257